jgi:hypothetical protein
VMRRGGRWGQKQKAARLDVPLDHDRRQQSDKGMGPVLGVLDGRESQCAWCGSG